MERNNKSKNRSLSSVGARQTRSFAPGRVLEEYLARHHALQKAITDGLNSGHAENFDMDALQQEIDHEC